MFKGVLDPQKILPADERARFGLSILALAVKVLALMLLMGDTVRQFVYQNF